MGEGQQGASVSLRLSSGLQRCGAPLSIANFLLGYAPVLADVRGQEEPGITIHYVPEVAVFAIDIHYGLVNVPRGAHSGGLSVHPLGGEPGIVGDPSEDRHGGESEVVDLTEVVDDFAQ